MAFKKAGSVSFLRVLVPVLVVILAGGIVVGGWFFYNGRKSNSSSFSGGAGSVSNNAKEPKILNTTQINKDLTLNLPSDDDEGLSIPVKLVSASRLDSIQVNGQPYSKSKGQTYLQLELEYTNATLYEVKPNSNNYVRLVDDQDRLFAPDFFNSQAVAPAEATIFDQVAFLVTDDQTHFKLRIGQVGDSAYETVEFDLN